jgi:hypothetical protein
MSHLGLRHFAKGLLDRTKKNTAVLALKPVANHIAAYM